MAIYVTTENPLELYKKIGNAINAGEIETWKIDDNKLLTHATSTGQWERAAWFGCKLEDGLAIFFIVGRNDRAMTIEEYAIYHGRFLEMLLSHFDHDATVISISPLIDTRYDKCPMNVQ